MARGESCGLCGERPVSCILGIDHDLTYRDIEDKRLTLGRDDVVRACDTCANTYVVHGNAREMPLEVGDAAEIWYEDKFEITDNKHSIWMTEHLDMEHFE